MLNELYTTRNDLEKLRKSKIITDRYAENRLKSLNDLKIKLCKTTESLLDESKKRAALEDLLNTQLDIKREKVVG